MPTEDPDTDRLLLASDRLRHYVGMRDAQPLLQADDCIHKIHTGSQWEAELLLSDIRAALEVLP